MGKRSEFARNPRDFYPTPIEAVRPLVPHLERGRFVEPCAGNGALVDHLEAAGMACVGALDIHPMRHDVRLKDALRSRAALCGGDFIITNPPWDRKILHPMIEHFSALRPTWLLIDADWAHTKQSATYMRWCRKIVSVGRVKWIPDSKYTGKENCCWYMFNQSSDAPCQFIGRAA